MIASICSEPTVLKVMKYINLFISIIRIVVPIILIFVASFKYISVIKTGDEDNLNKVNKTVITNAIAAVIIFLIPNLVNIIVKISFSENDYKNCLEANDAIIVQAYEDKMEKLVSKAEETLNIYDYNNAQLYLKNIKDEEKRKSFEEQLKSIKEKIDEANKKIENDIKEIADNVTPGVFTPDDGPEVKCNNSGKYNKCSPKTGIFGPFSYYDSEPNSTTDRWSMKINPAWQKENFVQISKTCSNGWVLNFEMHRLAKTTWEKVMDRLCMITTDGIDGYLYTPNDIVFSGQKASSVARFVGGTKVPSMHSYGTTIDINPDAKYTVNGKTFAPYQRDIKQYEGFVNALGNERDSRNVNFILWKKIFQPLGFYWGGNWKGGSYDGMHFEIYIPGSSY